MARWEQSVLVGFCRHLQRYVRGCFFFFFFFFFFFSWMMTIGVFLDRKSLSRSAVQSLLSNSKGTEIIKSKRQPPNLKERITKGRITDNRTSTTNFVSKCNRPNCELCKYLDESNSYNFNGKIFYVNETMSCDVRNVIPYNGCNEYYIGQTGNKLRTRRTIHAQQIQDPSTTQIPLSEHLDKCSTNNTKFRIFPFFKMRTESISARLAKEKHFIDCFKPNLNA